MSWLAQERPLLLARTRRVLTGLLAPAEFGAVTPLAAAIFEVPGEPCPVALALAADYTPIAVGERWGRRWGTAWFRFHAEVPADWADEEIVAAIMLGPGGTTGFGVEGLLWDGATPQQGLSPNHRWVPVAGGAASVDLLVEAAANPEMDGSLLMPDFGGEPFGFLECAELRVRYPAVASACHDVELLLGLLEHGRTDDPRTATVHRALSHFLAALNPDDVRGSLVAALDTLKPVLGARANASAHQVVAVGHAHIDTAWLWPVRESVRKAARSFSTAVTLMDDYPDYRFVASQAVHHAWMAEHYPPLFERIRAKVASGQFEPVGSMWVEADTNVPSGESLVRQLVYGKRFFAEAYGRETRDLWLPDVFGYSAALPQLMKLAGIDWFLTQKISWSQTNRFPHHTFWWEGLDGSRIFSHFPPADTYNGDASVGNLLHSSTNFRDHDDGHVSLYPFGWGDGGGGPTREHLERLARSVDTEGLPRVRLGGVDDFFEQATAAAGDLPVWSGELYLEYHRGTYTTQGLVKRNNRRGELLLREAELWLCTVGDRGSWPAQTLERLWKVLLVNQFHDIIPGSSIHWVYEVANTEYAALLAELDALIDTAAEELGADLDTTGYLAPVLVLNPLTHEATDVVTIGGRLRAVTAPGLGYVVVDASVPVSGPDVPVVVDMHGLENAHLRVQWDACGLLTSVWDKDAHREVLAPGGVGNRLECHHDRPLNFDAWDIDRYYLDAVTEITALDSLEVQTADAWRGEVRLVRRFGASRLTQTIRLDAGSRRLEFHTEVDWRERHKLLKVAFPVDVHASQASFEIQFGHVQRPTHVNTSWDWARFEVCAHRWADLSEPDYGVALLNDCKYGYDVRGNVLRLSLLRAPTSPDPEADQGHHEFTYALYPHQGDLRSGGVVAAAHALNAPMRVRALTPAGGTRPPQQSLVGVDRAGVVVESVKRAFDRDNLVVRVYEAFGSRQRVRLAVAGRVRGARRVDLLERPLAEPALKVEQSGTDGGGAAVVVELRPFEIATIELDLDDVRGASTGRVSDELTVG